MSLARSRAILRAPLVRPSSAACSTSRCTPNASDRRFVLARLDVHHRLHLHASHLPVILRIPPYPLILCAVEHYQVWNTALTLFDHFGSYAPAPLPLPPPPRACRINAPLSSHGLGNASARRATSTLRLAAIPLCKDHYERCVSAGRRARARGAGDNVKRARDNLDRAEALVRWVQGGGALPGSTTNPAPRTRATAPPPRRARAALRGRGDVRDRRARHCEAEGTSSYSSFIAKRTGRGQVVFCKMNWP
ncbi:hypothetical protein C8F04DRAFT_1366021 [Mycena alexandri]|uniref:Uncharacterized protein n=1 Tax=Mycena alexandri TaxID=1745969 RepID=A0AAD6WP56_9AGAR|nr:hypothetical protein C8F04DRAFT_1366021 [Mycena alexandri]